MPLNPQCHYENNAARYTPKQPKGKPSESIAVDPKLPADMHEEEKIAAYWRAIETWNQFDGTKRFRIPKTRLAVATSSSD